MQTFEDLRPKKLRILGRNYEVSFEDDLGGFLGLCDKHEQTIQIVEGQHAEEEADTVLHEALHAVFYLMDIGLTDKQEEHVVRKVATGLIQVFQDNPDFMTYLANAGVAGED